MRGRVTLIGVVVAACGVVAASLAAQGTREPDVLASLLTEVRGLRQAMEQMAAAGPRVQLALGRLQLQEQRLNTMIRRLEGVRDSRQAVERDYAEMQSRVSNEEEMLKNIDAHPKRDEIVRQAGGMIRELRRRMAVVAADLQRLQAEEAALQQQIAGEQARWADINRTLEELERALGRR